MSDLTPPAAGQPAAGAEPAPILIPKDRFDEVNEARKKAKEEAAALRDELGRYKSAEEERARAEAEKKGEYDKIKAEYEAKIADLTRTTQQLQENYTLAEMTRERGLKASPALIRAHASEMGVDLTAPGAWASVLDDFSAKYPGMVQTASPAPEKSSPGAAGHPGPSTVPVSSAPADPLLLIAGKMPGLGPFAGR